jgi:hypothetical protein
MSGLKELKDIAESGDWACDNAAGAELARAWLAEARDLANPSLIAGALRNAARSGRWGGVEVGFAFAIGAAALG